jgi:hypothetical protein
MGHALRVTEAGATPTEALTHGASKGGVAPASSEFGRVLPSFLFRLFLLLFTSSCYRQGEPNQSYE